MKLKSLTFAFMLIFCCVFATNLTLAQNSKEKKSSKIPFSERIFFGGSLGFSLGSNASLIDISPIFGYAITPELIAGVGLTYKFYRYADYFAEIDSSFQIVELHDFKSNMYGGSIYLRYFLTKSEIPVIENMFLHAEIEPIVFVNSYTPNPYGSFIDIYNNRYVRQNQQISLTGVFLGGGLRQPLGGRSYMYIEMVWNFSEDFYSPYNNPRIRIGVAAGF